MAALTKPQLARLAFWSANMTILRDSGYKWWPGFTYSDSEWAHMDKLAAPIGGWDFQKFIWLNALIFIVFAGIAVVCYMLPILLILYPDTRDLQPLPFTLLLASTTLIAIGVGLPLSMRISAWLCASDKLRASLASTAKTEALSARVSWQLTRMTLIMCGILIPGMLFWIAFSIDGGPILTVLKIVCALLVVGSTAFTALRRKSP
jgi:hypothetical protein